tara:strand:- start:346 stop:1500 length:1155 start_codon:yes stop_codon:yes gene_type:complete
MKVLVIAACPFVDDRGTPLRILGLVRGLQANGIDVHIVSYHLGRDLPDLKIHRIRNNPYKKMAPGPSWGKPFLDTVLVKKTIQIARKEKIQYIIGSHVEGAAIGLIAKTFLPGRKIFFDAHTAFADELVAFKTIKPNKVTYHAVKKIEKHMVKKCNHIFVDSPTLKTQFEKLGALEKNISVVPTGIDASTYDIPKEEIQQVRKSLGIEQQLFLYAGTLAPYQGIDLLLQAFSNVANQSTRLVVIGGSKEESAPYKQRFPHRQISFLGKIPFQDIPRYILASDILVAPRLPSKGTSSQRATKIISYMASGKPIIATDIPAHTCMINQENATIIAPNDQQAIEQALRETQKAYDQAVEKAKKGKEEIKKNYAWENVVQPIVNLLKD